MTWNWLAGAPADPTPGGARAIGLQAQVTADLAGLLRRSAPWRLLSNGAVACVVMALQPAGALMPWLAIWLALMLTHLGLSAWGPWGWWPRWQPRACVAQPQVDEARRWLQVTTWTETLTGLLWTAAELLILPNAELAQRALLMVILSVLAVGVLLSLSAHLPALYGYFVPSVSGFFVAGMIGHGPHFWIALVLLAVWLTINLNIARQLHRTTVESLRNRHLAAALAADMERQRDRAVDLGQARSRFLAAASHDLRQPVHALSMLVGALQQNLPAAQSRVILGHVESAVAAMGGMFNALLDISKLDASVVRPQWQVIDLRPLLERLAAGHAPTARSRGLAFESQFPGEALWVRTDPALLERVLGNLLSNALRYTTSGAVRMQARQRAGRVELVVADTGMGIPREQREAVFHEFVRLRAPGAPDESGLGLGLSIVRRLAELLQVRIRLRSRHERGTVFSLILPATAPVAAPDGGVQGSPQQDTCGGLRSGDVVLVVDDSAEVRTAMLAVLAAWGCEVITAASVAELMPQLMGLKAAPRLLLCDVRLDAGSGGLAAIEELREAFNEDLPAILVTGDTAPDRLSEAVAAGLPLLHKPVTLPQLREALRLALLPRVDSA